MSWGARLIRPWLSASLRVWLSASLRLWLSASLRSTRWDIRGDARAGALLTDPDEGTVVAFWHRSLTLSPALWFWARGIEPRLRLRVLISRNADGRLIADVVRPWEIIGIHGSSDRKGKDKGGASVLRAALMALEDGALVAITPDGPRGPPERVQPGAEALSRLAHRPVVPVGLACTGPRLPSWDGLFLPVPFGRGAMIAGAPLLAPDAATLKRALDDAASRAESLLRRRPFSWTDRLWNLAGTLASPVLTIVLQKRLGEGKELPGRLRERMGLGEGRRPGGRLLWIHAASVGETLCARPLLDELLERRPDLTVLFTTATVTGAEIVSRHPQARKRVLHRFIPYDTPRWTGRFLSHWRPDAAIFVESELWPGIVAACHARNVPAIVVNGRLSARSARRWARAPFLARRMFSRLAWVSARGAEDAARFRALGADPVFTDGDLKRDAPPLPFDEAELARLRALIGDRPVFVAASTHPGEEEIVIEAARLARRSLPGLLTIIVPRHPSRGAELAARFDLPRRAAGSDPQGAVWLADTLGELGLFFRLAARSSGRCFLGNSIMREGKGGGHNPFEPLRLRVPTATGPRMDNWREAVAALGEDLTIVRDAESLAGWIAAPVEKPGARATGPSVTRTVADRILSTVATESAPR